MNILLPFWTVAVTLGPAGVLSTIVAGLTTAGIVVGLVKERKALAVETS